MAKKIIFIAIVGLACLSWNTGWAQSASELMTTVNPDTIQIGAAYNGQAISVSGEIPSDATVLIRVIGEPEHYKLKQKGRAFGLLWMNLGSVEISEVPDVFLLYLPEGADDAQRTVWRDMELGLSGLRKQAKIVAEGEDKGDLLSEFIKLKQKSGLYGTSRGAVSFGPDNAGVKSFSAELMMPSALPQGAFNIEVYAIRNGSVTAVAVHKIVSREVGMPAWISALAFQHGTLYGVLSVIVAILAGLLTGVLFKGEKGAH